MKPIEPMSTVGACSSAYSSSEGDPSVVADGRTYSTATNAATKRRAAARSTVGSAGILQDGRGDGPPDPRRDRTEPGQAGIGRHELRGVVDQPGNEGLLHHARGLARDQETEREDVEGHGEEADGQPEAEHTADAEADGREDALARRGTDPPWAPPMAPAPRTGPS